MSNQTNALQVRPPPPHPPRTLAPRTRAPRNQSPANLFLVGIGFLSSALLFIPLGILQQDYCAPCPIFQPPAPCPLVPAGQNFSWIDYIPRVSFGTTISAPETKNDTVCPAWHVFNASDESASWKNPLLPTEEEAEACYRRIRGSYRQLLALWHPDRAAPPTATTVGSLRPLLNLSEPQLSMVARVFHQAYQDAMFGCMSGPRKSTWLNTLTDKQPAAWDVTDVDDVATDLDADGTADPSDLGLDLTPADFAHVQHCMEREGASWARALHRVRQQRRSLWWRCRSYIELYVSVAAAREADRNGGSGARLGKSPAIQRALMRQSVLSNLMERMGWLDGCRNTSGAVPWWEAEDGEGVEAACRGMI